MINYYKILGLENYASLEDIRAAYRDKIREFHPDLNPSESALEISKMLNMAKTDLDSQEKKEAYDRQLKLAYLVEINRLKDGHNQINERRRIKFQQRKKREEAKQLASLEKYKANLQRFPISARFVIIGLVAMWAFVLFHRNFFFTYQGIEPLKASAAAFIIIGCFVFVVNELYKHYYFKSLKEAVKVPFERLSFRILTIGLPLFFLLTYIGFSIQKSYWLNNNYEYYIADIQVRESHFLESFVYCFSVDGHTYCLEEDVTTLSTGQYRSLAKDHKLIIKYARPNPSVSKIAIKENLEKFYDPELELLPFEKARTLQ